MSTYIGPYFIGKLPKTTKSINVFGCEKCQTKKFTHDIYCAKCGEQHRHYDQATSDFIDFYQHQTEIDEVYVCSAEHHYSPMFDGYFVALPNKNKKLSKTALTTTSACKPYGFTAFSVDPDKMQDDIVITQEKHSGFLKNLDDAGIEVEIKWGVVEY